MRRGRPKNWIFPSALERWNRYHIFFRIFSERYAVFAQLWEQIDLTVTKATGTSIYRSCNFATLFFKYTSFIYLFSRYVLILIKLHLANLFIYLYLKKVLWRTNDFSAPFCDYLPSERYRERRPRFNWRSQFVSLCDYRAIRRPVTHKRHRRNREITVRRGSLAVSSILGTVEFRYRIRRETSREANRTRNDRLRGTGTTKHGYA